MLYKVQVVCHVRINHPSIQLKVIDNYIIILFLYNIYIFNIEYI